MAFLCSRSPCLQPCRCACICLGLQAAASLRVGHLAWEFSGPQPSSSRLSFSAPFRNNRLTKEVGRDSKTVSGLTPGPVFAQETFVKEGEESGSSESKGGPSEGGSRRLLEARQRRRELIQIREETFVGFMQCGRPRWRGAGGGLAGCGGPVGRRASQGSAGAAGGQARPDGQPDGGCGSDSTMPLLSRETLRLGLWYRGRRTGKVWSRPKSEERQL